MNERDEFDDYLEQVRDHVLHGGTYMYYAAQLYQNVDCVWRPIDDALINHYVDQEGTKLRNADWAALITQRFRSGVCDLIKARYLVENDKVAARVNPQLIAFNNGYIDIEALRAGNGVAFHPWGMEDLNDTAPLFFNKIPHDFNTEMLAKAQELNIAEAILAELAPKLHAFIGEIVGQDRILFQLYKIGYCLLRSNPYKVMFIELGEKDAGKTTFINVLKAVLGSDNISGESMQRLADYPFSLVELADRFANIYDDLPLSAIQNTGQLKMLTGNSPISAPRKFKVPLRFTPYAKLIFSANNLPKIRQLDDDAFFSRVVTTEYKNKFPRTDFGERIVQDEKELQGLIVAALFALRDLAHLNVFDQDNSRWVEIWKRSLNPVYDFACSMQEAGTLVLQKDVSISKTDLYDLYTDWDENPQTQNKFTMELNRLYGIKADRRITQDGRQQWAYGGIGRPQAQSDTPPQPTGPQRNLAQNANNAKVEPFGPKALGLGVCEMCGEPKNRFEHGGRALCVDCINVEQHRDDDQEMM